MTLLQVSNASSAGTEWGTVFFILIGILILRFIIKKIGLSTVGYTLSRNYSGVSSPLTTYFLGKIIKKMIKNEGYKVSKIDIVHQLGNCYQGLVLVDGEKNSLSIVADKYGNVSYSS